MTDLTVQRVSNIFRSYSDTKQSAKGENEDERAWNRNASPEEM